VTVAYVLTMHLRFIPKGGASSDNRAVVLISGSFVIF
jgi:hypothetical protein